MNITINTPNSDKEASYAKPKIGENIVKVMGIVNLGMVKSQNPQHKDQSKFVVYFATPEGAQLRNEFSATWGENSRWRILCEAWAGKSLLNPINPQDLLGCQGTAVVVPNAKFFNINTMLPGIHKKSELVFPSKVFISSMLKGRGTAFEVETASNVTVELVAPVAKTEATSKVMVQAIKASQPQSFESVNAFAGVKNGLGATAPTVAVMPVSREVEEEDLPF